MTFPSRNPSNFTIFETFLGLFLLLGATEMKTALQQQSFGDAAFNSTLTGVSVCLQDGRRLEKIEFIDSAGGVVLTLQGNFRIPNKGKGGGVSAYYNFEAMGMSLPVTKGYTMKITTKDAAI